jgi:2EXR family
MKKSSRAHSPQNQAQQIPTATTSEVMQETSRVSTINFSCSIRTLTKSEQDSSAMENSQVIGMNATNPPPLPGTSIREIQSIAKALQSSTMQFLSTISDELAQLALKSFMNNILASTSKIETLSGSLVTTGTIGQFIFFPKLPMELRLKIWTLALPGPRIIEIYQNFNIGIRFGNEIQANNPPPALFHVNREAREVASKKYMKLYNNIDSQLYFCHPRFDPNEDTIFIPWSVSRDKHEYQTLLIDGSWWSDDARAKVQYLAMDSRMWEEKNKNLEFASCTSLKQFTLVVHEKDGLPDRNGNSRYGCIERWRMSGTDLAFEEPLMTKHLDPKHKRFIKGWGDIVLKKMEEEMHAAAARGINWDIPKINVKILIRNGKRCCWNEYWGRV